MYSEINTEHGIATIKLWLDRHRHALPDDYPIKLVTDGLELVMNNNVIQFDDSYWLQLSGTVMGASSACMYATISYSYHEETALPSPTSTLSIRYYHRFIDDGIYVMTSEPNVTPEASCHRVTEIMNDFDEPGKRLEMDSYGTCQVCGFPRPDTDNWTRRKTQNENLPEGDEFVLVHTPIFCLRPRCTQRTYPRTATLRRFRLHKTDRLDYVKAAKSFCQRLLNRGHDFIQLKKIFLSAAVELKKLSPPT
jgi:hypothetical protein